MWSIRCRPKDWRGRCSELVDMGNTSALSWPVPGHGLDPSYLEDISGVNLDQGWQTWKPFNLKIELIVVIQTLKLIESG